VLGWEIFIKEKSPSNVAIAEESPSIATWRVSLGGTQWLDDLAAEGLARDPGGNGYLPAMRCLLGYSPPLSVEVCHATVVRLYWATTRAARAEVHRSFGADTHRRGRRAREHTSCGALTVRAGQLRR
jgi:hypothetical protein